MYIKRYPYLQDIYHNYDDEKDRQDKQVFLDSLDSFINHKTYIKITLLDWDENPLKEISGKLISGTITKDGSSAVRRTCSFSATVSGGEYNIEDMQMDFGINRKIYLEIGVVNYSRKYPEYPILWFPQGMFIISSFSMSSSTSTGVNISLQCKDKMCLLNGELGGIFPAATILDTMDTQTDDGAYINKKVRIYNLIQEIVHHFGGEHMQNIVIEGVSLHLRRVMKWTGSTPLYIRTVTKGNATVTEASLENDGDGWVPYNNGDDVGYIYDDFYYTGDLTANAGQNVCNILDTIKNYLGNYEYYYDIYGIFHFQEVKNYLNTTQAKILVKDMNKNDYLVDTTTGKDLYSFSGGKNLVSISVNPQYNNIKNDFIVQGLRKSADNNTGVAVRYHLAIDSKPIPIRTVGGKDVYGEWPCFLVYKEPLSELYKGAEVYWVDSLPDPGNFNLIYGINNDSSKFYYWDNEYKEVEVIQYFDKYEPTDWRTELYCRGLAARNSAVDGGYYWPELESGWPMVYDLQNQRFWAEKNQEELPVTALCDGDYFLDFIDPATTYLGKYSVDAIGRRQYVNSNDKINCLFVPSVPDVIFIRADGSESEEIKRQTTLARVGQEVICQVKPEIYDNLLTGGYRNAAFDAINFDLMNHTTYQSSINITAVPAFYMEPNTRISVADNTTNTYGSYVMTNVSIPLAPGGNMSVTAREVFERY